MDEILTSLKRLCLCGENDDAGVFRWYADTFICETLHIKAAATFSEANQLTRVQVTVNGEEVYHYDGYVRRQVAGIWQHIVVGLAKALGA